MDRIDDSLKHSDESSQQNESGSSKYDESWSSTLPSFQETPVKSPDDVSMISSAKEHSIEDFLEQQGTLSNILFSSRRFVQRFRKQPPLSREQRIERSQEKTTDFWWLQNGTETCSKEIDLPKEDKYPIITPPKPNKKKSCVPFYNSPNVVGMQSRADKLLEMSGSTLNEGPLSDNTTTLSKYQKSPASHVLKDEAPSHTRNHTTEEYTRTNPWVRKERLSPSKPKAKMRADDDILYQWRLARKMEIASQEVQEQNPYLHKTRSVLADKTNLNFTDKKTEVTSYSPVKSSKHVENLERKETLDQQQKLPENESQQREKNYERDFIKNNQHLQSQYPQFQNFQPYLVQPMIHTCCHGNCLHQHYSGQSSGKVSTGVQVERLTPPPPPNREDDHPSKERQDVHERMSEKSDQRISSCSESQESQILDEESTEENGHLIKPTIPVINEVISKHLFPDEMITSSRKTREAIADKTKSCSSDKEIVPQKTSNSSSEFTKVKQLTSKPRKDTKVFSKSSKPTCDPQNVSTEQIRFEFLPTKGQDILKSDSTKQQIDIVEDQVQLEEIKSSTPRLEESPDSISQIPEDEHLNQQTQNDLLESSSEEEFCDDDILNDLRKRRNDIQRRLKEISKILSSDG
uniref:Uncharacterized protein n=1 Tax=Clytia hemisphaerica TaxID=252671 RepID=A0A7M5V4N5_9CNID